MSDVRVIDCEEALNRLLDYLDAELAGEPNREMEHHLARCRTCFSRLEFEKRLKAHTAELGHEPVGDDLQQRIRALLDSFKC
jgi:anti-sigma factor (TIGR02949 family)